METLTEFIQGPCVENQKNLIRAKVIDNCRDLISSFTSEKERLSKGFNEQSQDLVNDLKSFAVELLLSLIEGKPDPETILRMT